MADPDREATKVDVRYAAFLSRIAPLGMDQIMLMHEPRVLPSNPKTLRFFVMAFPGEYSLTGWSPIVKDVDPKNQRGDFYRLECKKDLEEFKGINTCDIELFVPYKKNTAEISDKLNTGALRYKVIELKNASYADITV